MLPAFVYSRSMRAVLMASALSLLATAAPAPAATKSLDSRVDRLEKEMRAVQRQVFPGGDGQVVAPDAAPTVAAPAQVGTPATSPLLDLTARVNAIEAQLARMTGQVEENGHRLKLLEADFAKLVARQKTDSAAIKSLLPVPGGSPDQPSEPAAAQSGETSSAAKAPVPPPAPKKDDAAEKARTQAVAKIARPKTGNAANDSYVYGYRLWSAKFYPEAEAQLQATLDKYGSDPIASKAGNLLGRAYLDDGKPTQAAKVFYENYRKRPNGDRAAESLAWTAESLIQLKRFKLACQAYGELKDAFGSKVPASVLNMVAKGRVAAKCSD